MAGFAVAEEVPDAASEVGARTGRARTLAADTADVVGAGVLASAWLETMPGMAHDDEQDRVAHSRNAAYIALSGAATWQAMPWLSANPARAQRIALTQSESDAQADACAQQLSSRQREHSAGMSAAASCVATAHRGAGAGTTDPVASSGKAPSPRARHFIVSDAARASATTSPAVQRVRARRGSGTAFAAS